MTNLKKHLQKSAGPQFPDDLNDHCQALSSGFQWLRLVAALGSGFSSLLIFLNSSLQENTVVYFITLYERKYLFLTLTDN